METSPEPDASRARQQAVPVVGWRAGHPPKSAFFPPLAMPRWRRLPWISGSAILVASALLFALALGGIYLGDKKSHVSPRGAVLQLVGAAPAPNATASLRIGVADLAGNRPLQLSVRGLPQVLNGYYTLFLVEGGRPPRSCGAFLVSTPGAPTTVRLSVPYRLTAGDRWIVTEESPAQRGEAKTVLRGIPS